MNTTNEKKETSKRMMKLEELAPEQQSGILEMALNASLVDVTNALRGHGINTSPASLSRFIRRDREKRLLEDRKEMAGAVEAFAEGGRDGKLREGTLEVVRQQLYERAVVSRSAEEARELYAAMVKEEARLKELELEARKVAALEQQVKLQGLRFQVEAERSHGPRGKVSAGRAEVIDSKAEGEAEAKLELRGPREDKQRLLVVLREVKEIVNRGGSTDEVVLELRARLAGELKGVETAT